MVVTYAIIISSLLTTQSSFIRADVADDVPQIRRVLLQADRVAAELDKVKHGALRQLPRADFDDLLARATESVAARRDPPSLLETHYHASLSGEALVGSATWKMQHRHAGIGRLLAEPFGLALRQATWDDGTPALIASAERRPASSGVQVLVGRPGAQGLNFDWSALGISEPGGLRFDLRVPPSPIAVFELELPADREPAAPRVGAVVTGPTSGPTADRHTWRIMFSNMSQLDLVLRPSARRDQPTILVTRRSRQEISPGRTESEFVFDLEAPHGGVRALDLALDPDLRPTGVTVRGLDHWEVRPADGVRGPNHLFIMLTEPLTAGSVTLRAAAPAPLDGWWTSPSAEVVGGVPRGAEIAVRVHPDLTADDWRPGAYRPVTTAHRPDHWQEVTFRTALFRLGTSPVGCRLRTTGPQYRATERLWWQARTDRVTLKARISFEIARGAVFEVPLSVPPGWEVARVEADPPELLAPAIAAVDAGILRVGLQRPMTPTSPARLTIQMTRRPPRPDEVIAVPDVVPLAVTGRVGFLAAKVGPGLEFEALPRPLGADPSLSEPPPWGDDPPDYVFALGGKPISNGLRYVRRPGRIQARIVASATVVGDRAAVGCRVRLETAGGSPESLLFRVRGPLDDWDWQVTHGPNRVRSVRAWADPLPHLSAALAAALPWQVLMAVTPPDLATAGFWQVTLIRPLTEPIELEAAAEIHRPPGRPWRIPLLDLPAAERDENEVSIDCRSSPNWDARGSGADEIISADGSPWRRTFRYGRGPAALTVAPRADGEMGIVDEAVLVIYVGQGGRTIHHLRFRLRDWERLAAPVEFPPDAAIRQVRVDGKEARPRIAGAANGRFRIEVPVATDRRTESVDIVYDVPYPADDLVPEPRAVEPRLPCPGSVVRYVWCLPAEYVPLGQWNMVSRDDADGTRDLVVPSDLARGAFWRSDNRSSASIRIVRRSTLQWAGILTSMLILAGAWAARFWPAHRQWLALAVWIFATGSACVLLEDPWPIVARWLFGAAILTVTWKLLRLVRPVEPVSRSALRAAATNAAVLVATLPTIIGVGLGAAGSASVLVYLVPAVENAAEVQSVLLPADLFARLQAEAGSGTLGPDVVWQEARYEGRVTGGQVGFTAELRLHSFADDPPPVVLALNAVRLRDATLDGSPAFLRSAGDHYLVPIRGRGSHTLMIAFDTPVSAYPPPAADGRSAGTDREFQFAIPEIPITRLRLSAPAAARELQCISGRGRQHVDPDPEGPRLEADVGRASMVHVRWQTESANTRSATIRTNEAYLWDLNDTNARLVGSIRYDISPGTVTTLAVGLPNGLEVVGVVARPLDAPTTDAGTGWLREWHVETAARSGGRPSLVLDFAGSICRRWQVNFELVPRENFSRAFTLQFPSPGGTRSAPPVFAWRATGVELEDTPPQTALPLTVEAFVRDHWLAARTEADPRLPTKAYQRTGVGQAPALLMRVAPSRVVPSSEPQP
jgi:hypothetical protein